MKSLSVGNGQSLGGARAAEAAGRRYRVMHLATYAVPHVGGVEMHMHELCKALSEQLDVREVGGGGPRFRSTQYLIDGFPVTQLATPLTLRSAPICPEIPLTIRASKADLVHLHMPNPFGAAAYLASGHNGPLISHMALRRSATAPHEKAVQAAVQTHPEPGLGGCRDFAQHCPNLQRCCRLFSGRVRVIPYGIDYEPYNRRRESEVAAIRQRYGSKIVLGVGRLIYYKGFQYLLSAMSEVDAKLLIVGEGPLREELERQVQAEGTNDRVEFHRRENTRSSLSHSTRRVTCSLLSSVRGEAFGIVQLEAMAAGKPVVNTMLDSGVPFVSRDHESGYTVAPHDSKGLAEAINRLLEDEPLRLRYGREGKLRMQREFSVREMTQATLKLYGEALSDTTLIGQVA